MFGAAARPLPSGFPAAGLALAVVGALVGAVLWRTVTFRFSVAADGGARRLRISAEAWFGRFVVAVEPDHRDGAAATWEAVWLGFVRIRARTSFADVLGTWRNLPGVEVRGGGPAGRAVGRALSHLLGRVRVTGLTVDGRLGLGDASRTALVCGGLWALWGSAAGRMQRRRGAGDVFGLRLRPEYNRWVFVARIEGRVAVRPVYLLSAGGRAAAVLWRPTPAKKGPFRPKKV